MSRSLIELLRSFDQYNNLSLQSNEWVHEHESRLDEYSRKIYEKLLHQSRVDLYVRRFNVNAGTVELLNIVGYQTYHYPIRRLGIKMKCGILLVPSPNFDEFKKPMATRTQGIIQGDLT